MDEELVGTPARVVHTEISSEHLETMKPRGPHWISNGQRKVDQQTFSVSDSIR